VSLPRLAEKRGIALRRHGADLLGLCPFHDNHEPFLVISPAKNLWHCLGACGAEGSLIDWVMRTEGISFRYAVELLRADLPAGTGTGSAPGRSVTASWPRPSSSFLVAWVPAALNAPDPAVDLVAASTRTVIGAGR